MVWAGSGIRHLISRVRGQIIGLRDISSVLTSHDEFEDDPRRQQSYTGRHRASCRFSWDTHGGHDDRQGHQSKSQGQAPRASILAYDHINDYAEMNTAAANGMTLSNHSYAKVSAGWEFNSHDAPIPPNQWAWFGAADIDPKRISNLDSIPRSSRMGSVGNGCPRNVIAKSSGNDGQRVPPPILPSSRDISLHVDQHPYLDIDILDRSS